MDTAYVSSAEEVLEHFNVTEHDGLNDGAVEASRAKYGRNGEREASTEISWTDSV